MSEQEGADQPQGTEEEEAAPAPVQSEEQVETSTGDSQEAMPTSNDEAEELPEGVKDRTKREFEKLQEKLREEREARLKLEQQVNQSSPFDILKPTAQDYENLSPTQVEQIAEDFTDTDGYVDEAKLRQALDKANNSAQQAYQYAQSVQQRLEQQEEQRQVRETVAKYPALDPNSDTYDSNFAQLVQNQLVADYAQGKNADYLSAADKVSQIFKTQKPEKVVREEVKQELTKKQDQKNQGPIESGRGEDRESISEQDLAGRTDDQAIAERLAKKGVNIFG